MKVKVTWKAFGDKPFANRYVSSAEFELHDYIPAHPVLLDSIYEATNLQSELAEFGKDLFTIYLWKVIEARLPENRTHTSISVGDEIEIDGTTYVCADIGWITSDNADIKYAPDGFGAVYSVKAKEKING